MRKYHKRGFFSRIVSWLRSIFIVEKKPFLSRKVKVKAHIKFNKLLNRFRNQHRREPTHDELFRIIINASHLTVRRRGKSGHWGRQKVRKMLLEEQGIPFKMK